MDPRERIRSPRATQDADFRRRIVGGAIAGAAAFAGMVQVSRAFDPWSAAWMPFLVLGVFVAACVSSTVVMAARSRPDNRALKFLIFPLCLGLAAAVLSLAGVGSPIDVFSGREIFLEALPDVLENVGRPDLAGGVRRIPLVQPILSAAVAVTMSVLFIGAIRSPSFSRRLILYPTGLLLLVAVRILVPLAVFGGRIPGGIEREAFGWAPVLEGFLIGLAVDAGQAVGGTQLAARRWKECLAGLATVLLVAAALLWRPFAADLHCILGLLNAEESEAAAVHFRKAFALCPERWKVPYLYVTMVLSNDAFRSIRDKDHTAAIAVCEEAIRILPEFPDPHALAAIACKLNGDRRGAVEHHRLALDAARRMDRRSLRSLGLPFRPNPEYYEGLLIASLAGEGSEESARELLEYVEGADRGQARRALEAITENKVRSAVPGLRALLDRIEEESRRAEILGALDTLDSEEE